MRYTSPYLRYTTTKTFYTTLNPRYTTSPKHPNQLSAKIGRRPKRRPLGSPPAADCFPFECTFLSMKPARKICTLSKICYMATNRRYTSPKAIYTTPSASYMTLKPLYPTTHQTNNTKPQQKTRKQPLTGSHYSSR